MVVIVRLIVIPFPFPQPFNRSRLCYFWCRLAPTEAQPRARGIKGDLRTGICVGRLDGGGRANMAVH